MPVIWLLSRQPHHGFRTCEMTPDSLDAPLALTAKDFRKHVATAYMEDALSHAAHVLD
jgi:hypothetical protein